MKRRKFIAVLTKISAVFGIFATSPQLIAQQTSAIQAYSNKKEETKKEKNIRVLIHSGNVERFKNLKMYENGAVYQNRKYQFKETHSGIVYSGIKINEANPINFAGNSYSGKLVVVKERNDNFLIINQLPIEQYLQGVVGNEISYKWSTNAIEAQAIAARSYAYSHIYKNPTNTFHVDGTEKFQVFNGNLSKTKPTIQRGIANTHNNILTYRNTPITTFFHSCCGGMTEKAEAVWKKTNRLPYFKNIRCHYCKNFPLYQWEKNIPFTDVNERLAFLNIGNIRSIKVSKRNYSKRVQWLTVVGTTGQEKLNGANFRRAFSSHKFFSTIFRINRQGNSLKFTGNGNGHGVGLCQAGAKTMAERGYATEKILSFYYKNINFDTISSVERRKMRQARFKKVSIS